MRPGPDPDHGPGELGACGEALGLDLINQPELLEQQKNACLSAAWFGATNGLNTLADAEKFETIMRRINGGLNGQADRLKLWGKATAGLAWVPPALKMALAGVLGLLLLMVGGTWKVQDWRYGKQLASR